jgi:DNA-binding NarL/FixJ family response regulator
VIRVLLVSGHPAIRAGLAHVIDGEPGLGAEIAGSTAAAVANLALSRPDLIVLDVPLPGEDAFEACHTLKQLASARRVALLTDRRSEILDLAAWMARADAVIDKATPVPALFDQLRLVAGGRRVVARPTLAALSSALRDTSTAERAVVGMCLHGAELDEISRALRRDPLEIETMVRGLIRQLGRPATEP